MRKMGDFIDVVATQQRVINKLITQKQVMLELLKESVAFMNLVPNRKYGDNYELCSRIDKFLKELE